MGHGGNKLMPKCDGYIGKQEANNNGVFQGIPRSATLFTIYAEKMAIQYNANLPGEIGDPVTSEKIRNIENGNEWANYQSRRNKNQHNNIYTPRP